MADDYTDSIDDELARRERTRKFAPMARENMGPGMPPSPSPSPVPTAPPIKKEPGYIDMLKHFFHLDQQASGSGADQAKALRGGQ